MQSERCTAQCRRCARPAVKCTHNAAHPATTPNAGHASAIAPNLTLWRADVAQSDATDVPYKFASNYFDVAMGVADWSVKTTTGAFSGPLAFGDGREAQPAP